MKKVQFCEKTGLKRGKWSLEEDHQLVAYIKNHGIWNWKEMAKAAGLPRTGKSCRLRWMNYLKPNLKHGNFTKEEDDIIVQMYASMGSKWSRIAARLSGRSDNDVKNHWHTNLRKHNKHRNKIKKDSQNEKSFSITMGYDKPYNITNETNFINSFEPPLSIADYEIEESLKVEIEDTPSSSSSDQMYYFSSSSSSITRYKYEEDKVHGSCKAVQDENRYWDMLLMMISENQFPQFEDSLQEIIQCSSIF
ncbi:transcription factor WER-like [Impatiens glandulifera]|uniref:transcription factor WER-like n=1 Tax=Impatiens glandulifera TaxID=253017 RepID=UPI001FB157D3|nr:transcription factor WER-like [Impatiens glandulifera]